mmetsp:Transcript_104941/g.321486  ORF Transcript_104941/g.321486 Transcript_104941/m.321486 type:complete len:281 (+) Transcript_104941:2391-3233(+)
MAQAFFNWYWKPDSWRWWKSISNGRLWASGSASLSIRKSPRCMQWNALVSKSFTVMNLASGCSVLKSADASPEKPTTWQADTNSSSVTMPEPFASMPMHQAIKVFPYFADIFWWSSFNKASVLGSKSANTMKLLGPCCGCRLSRTRWPTASSTGWACNSVRWPHNCCTLPWKPIRFQAWTNSPKVSRPLPSKSNASRQARSNEPHRRMSAFFSPSTLWMPSLNLTSPSACRAASILSFKTRCARHFLAPSPASSSAASASGGTSSTSCKNSALLLYVWPL